ncbi:MAG: hypothetical protein GXY38_08420 [Planctomycetes bacterium]|nr:hypothetical protein [Planctomycetota bacterium]
MNYHRMHLVEKLQVQVSGFAGMAIVYFALWRLFEPANPHAPFVLLVAGGLRQMFLLVALIIAVAAFGAAFLAKSRPHGVLLASLLTALGVSLRSPMMRGLFWSTSRSGIALYWPMIAELLILAATLVVAAAIIDIIRKKMSRALPNAAWVDPLAGVDAQKLAKVGESWAASPAHGGLIISKAAFKVGSWRPLAAGALTLAGGLVLLRVTLQSSDRGQIIFALLASFGIAAMAVNQLMPARCTMLIWISPVIAAVLLYLLAAAAPIPATANGWINYPVYGRITPLDWITAGCGGAIAGCWISARMHESRIAEKLSELPGR